MTELRWQKSSYSEEGSACIYVATAPAYAALIRESEEPETIIATSRKQLNDLITAVRASDIFPAAHNS